MVARVLVLGLMVMPALVVATPSASAGVARYALFAVQEEVFPVDAPAADPVPPEFVVRPGVYLVGGVAYDMRREGFYDLPGGRRVVYQTSLEALMSGLSWTMSYGSDDEGLTGEEMISVAEQRPLLLRCGAQIAFVRTILARLDIGSRDVSTVQRDPPGAGHTLVEVYEGERWTLFDPTYGIEPLIGGLPTTITQWDGNSDRSAMVLALDEDFGWDNPGYRSLLGVPLISGYMETWPFYYTDPADHDYMTSINANYLYMPPDEFARFYWKPPTVVAPASVDAGSADVGSTAEVNVTVANTGELPLDLIWATVSGPAAAEFAWQASGCSDVAPGGACVVHVSFSPSVDALRTAYLNLFTNTPSRWTTVELVGTGLLPDVTPPSVRLESGPAAVTRETNVTFVFSSSDGSARFECRLDGGSYTGCSSPVSYAGLAEGAHAFAVRASDLAGNSAIVSASFSVDLTPPAAPARPDLAAGSDSGGSASDNRTNRSTLALAGTTENGSTVTLFRGSTAVGTATADAAGAWSLADSVPGDGVYSYTATATDIAGNTSPTSDPLAVTVDTLPPRATTPDLATASDGGALNSDEVTNRTALTLTGTAEAVSLVSLYRGATVVGTARVAAPDGAWSIDDTVAADGHYAYSATATDIAGNTSPTSDSLAVTVDTLPPALNISGTPSGTVYTLPDLPSRPSFDPTDTGSGIAEKTDHWTTPLGGSGAGSYSYTASATDRAGNSVGESRSYSVVAAGGGGGVGGGGGGGGSAFPDLHLEVSAEQAVAPVVGGEIVWHLTVSDRPNTQSAFGVFAEVTLPIGFTVTNTYSDRGTGCVAAAPGLVCSLDYIGAENAGHVIIWGKVGQAGAQTLSAQVRHFLQEGNPADDTASLSLQPAALPPPVQPVKPLIARATITPAAKAGKRVTVSFRVTRGDTGKPLTSGKMICDPSINGKLIRHVEQFKQGVARLTFTIPKNASGKLLKVKLTMKAASQAATRITIYRIK